MIKSIISKINCFKKESLFSKETVDGKDDEGCGIICFFFKSFGPHLNTPPKVMLKQHQSKIQNFFYYSLCFLNFKTFKNGTDSFDTYNETYTEKVHRMLFFHIFFYWHFVLVLKIRQMTIRQITFFTKVMIRQITNHQNDIFYWIHDLPNYYADSSHDNQEVKPLNWFQSAQPIWRIVDFW